MKKWREGQVVPSPHAISNLRDFSLILHPDDDRPHKVALFKILLDGFGVCIVAVRAPLHDRKISGHPLELIPILEGHHFAFPTLSFMSISFSLSVFGELDL